MPLFRTIATGQNHRFRVVNRLLSFEAAPMELLFKVFNSTIENRIMQIVTKLHQSLICFNTVAIYTHIIVEMLIDWKKTFDKPKRNHVATQYVSMPRVATSVHDCGYG